MNKRDCMLILLTMACGSSRYEKEAVEYVEKMFKQAKKAKRWKRKYLEISNQYCVGVSMNIVGDKYEFRFTDGTIKVVDCIVDKRGGVE